MGIIVLALTSITRENFMQIFRTYLTIIQSLCISTPKNKESSITHVSETRLKDLVWAPPVEEYYMFLLKQDPLI